MNQRLPFIAAAAVIFGLILLTYSNHFHNSFHFDDSHTIEDNAYIRDIKNIPLFFKDCTTTSSMPTHQGYRPLVTTTLAIDYALSMKASRGKDGYNTLWYHISNFSWFVLIVTLLYFMQVKLYDTAFTKQPYNKYFALLGCAWYGLHTVNAETVNYIIARSDILSTLAIVASFAIYISFDNLRKYYIYTIPAILGMFAKETTIMFAPALMVYDYMIERQKSIGDLFKSGGLETGWKSIRFAIPVLVICVALGYLSVKMQKVIEIKGNESSLSYIITQPYIALHYVSQFFLPMGLSADTDISVIDSWADDRLLIGFAFLIGLIILAFKTSEKKEWRPFSFGIIWFLLMLLPTSLVALAEVTNDHRAFLPFIGLIFSIVCLVANLYYYIIKSAMYKKALLGVVCLALAGYAYGTHHRNNVWKTDEALWKDVSEKSPRNGRGWMNYGLTLMARGDYPDAQYAFDQALIYTPRYYILQVNLGVLKEAEGQKIEAEQYYKNALDDGPNYVEPYYYYARYLFNMGRIKEAEIYCNKGLDIFPGHIYSRYLIMDIYYNEKDWPKLTAAAQTTMNMYPGDSKAEMYIKVAQNPTAIVTIGSNNPQTADDLLNQSLAYYRAGKYRECIDACFKALQLQPNYAQAYNNIGTAYNMLEKYDSAVWACNKALELQPDFPLAKGNLDWAKSQLKKK